MHTNKHEFSVHSCAFVVSEYVTELMTRGTKLKGSRRLPRAGLGHLALSIWDLFRVSGFGFRIQALGAQGCCSDAAHRRGVAT